MAVKVVVGTHKGELWWKAVFSHYAPFWIGRVRKMPRLEDAIKIVRRWRLLVIDGRPYYLDGQVWRAYGTSSNTGRYWLTPEGHKVALHLEKSFQP